MTRSRRTLLALSATVVLFASACGDDPDATGAPPVIQLAAPASAAGGALQPSSTGADAARELSMLADLEYVLAGELPALDGPAGSWVVPAGTSVTIEQVRALAAALGVPGEPRPQPAEWGGGWMVGPDDGTAPSLGVSGDSMAYWWYSPAWADDSGVGRCGVVEPLPIEGDAAATEPGTKEAGTDVTAEVTPEGGEVPVVDCVEPVPPANVPTADEAEALARQLLAELGEDPGQYLFETYADEWGANVTAYLLLEGVRSPLIWSVSYGGDGVLQYAGGTLADPQRSEDYPRIGTAAGFERLRTGEDPMYGVGRWSAYAAAEQAIAEGEPAPPDVAIDPAVGMPAPSEPLTPPEPVVVSITGVEEELVQVWDVDGTVHLLPGYAFVSSDGGRYLVSAVPAEYLVPVEPVPVEPVPVEPVPADTGVVPAPGEATGETPAAPIDPAFLESLVGVPEDEAVAAIEEAGWQARVVERDGEPFPATMDYREDRINLVVAGGLVTEATVG
jgi:hypothetical protein